MSATSGFPLLTATVDTCFWATHSLPSIGVAHPHGHMFTVAAGYRHEINPHMGCTKSFPIMLSELESITSKLEGSDLTELLNPFPPTIETLACYIMAKLPPYWMFVEISAYDHYRVRVDANAMRSVWAEQYRTLP